MLTMPLVIALSTLMQAGQTAPPPPAPRPTSQTVSPPSAPRPTILELRVTDRTGATLEGAHVKAEGPVGREGRTDRNGSVTFRNLSAGNYRFRIERDGFVTLEKEVTVRAGATSSAEAALTIAPAAPAPPPPPPAPSPAPVAASGPVFAPGEPRVLSITDFVEKQFIGPRETVKESPIGCSGATASRLIQAREPLAPHTHADADEMLYVVGGEATLKLGDKEHAIAAGWLTIVPRGTEHSVTRRGRNPVILLSILGGPSCAGR